MVRTSLLILTLGVHLGWHVANRKSRQYAISRECVCVCHTLFPRVFTRRGPEPGGGSPANEDTPHRGADVPAINCCPSCSTVFFAFMVVFMICPPNQVSMHGVNSVC